MGLDGETSAPGGTAAMAAATSSGRATIVEQGATMGIPGSGNSREFPGIPDP